MKKTEQYKILKVLNNNVVLARNISNKTEQVLIGTGIGFNTSKGEEVELKKEKIKKSFMAYDEELEENFLKLLKEFDPELMGICEEIISIAEEKIGELDSHIHIALTDHINFAVERLRNGMDINNPFTDEIKFLYEKEYEIGEIASKKLKEANKIDIPESEIAFIAMHIHAARKNKAVSETVRYTSLLKEVIELIEDELGIKLEKSNINYSRLITHIRFSINRMQQNKIISNPLKEKIREEFTESYQIAQKIGKIVEKKLDLKVNEDELGYITLHLQRLR